ncbi:unnamed protein product [Miscanthus lutarioriparius]|uniref:Uncharacterized protein n=1 Tax=Miscanthus lutarioriparius TaxID=422564 RepID=A0A811NSI9_9POAL|nr:unnamed protein product [Miscanthus lutarioriparius]
MAAGRRGLGAPHWRCWGGLTRVRERLGERGQPAVAGTRGGAQAGGPTQGGLRSPRTGWDGTHAGGAGSGARGSVVNSGGVRERGDPARSGSPPRTRGGGFFLSFLFAILSEGGGLDEGDVVTRSGQECIGCFQKLACVADIRWRRVYRRGADGPDWRTVELQGSESCVLVGTIDLQERSPERNRVFG